MAACLDLNSLRSSSVASLWGGEYGAGKIHLLGRFLCLMGIAESILGRRRNFLCLPSFTEAFREVFCRMSWVAKRREVLVLVLQADCVHPAELPDLQERCGFRVRSVEDPTPSFRA